MLRFIPQASGPVVIRELTRETIEVLTLADRWSQHANVAVDLNACDNGEHSRITLHGQSRAWDFDTQGDLPDDLKSLFFYLRSMLPPGYDVVLESTHVHIEWQPKR